MMAGSMSLAQASHRALAVAVAAADDCPMQGIITFAVAFGVTLGVVWWRGDPADPVWSLVLGPGGAGVLAAAMVMMRETFIEDLVKAGIFTVIGGVLLFQGVPPWMGWAMVMGPWVGLVFNGGGARAPRVSADEGAAPGSESG